MTPDFPAGGGARVAITVSDRVRLDREVARRLDDGAGFTLATLNLDHLVKLRRDAQFRAAYQSAELITADGRPVVWLSRLAGRPVALTPGSELVRPLCALAARRDVPVAFYGSDAATLDAAATALEAAIPGLRVILRIAPAYGFDPTGAAAAADATRIAASGARLCFVALGAPKQERFATFARTIAPTCGFACIGAGLDFVVGRQTRAPAWMRALAMEWLWRMAGNPRRLAGRYLACALALPRLTADALRQRLVADQ